MANFHVQYDRSIDGLVGGAAVDTAFGRIPIVVTVPLRPIAKLVAEMLLDRVVAASGVSGDEVGFFGFLKKAWNAVWSTAKKVARAIGLTKLVRAVKNGIQKVVKWAGNVIRSPVFGAIVGVATLIPASGRSPPRATPGSRPRWLSPTGPRAEIRRPSPPSVSTPSQAESVPWP